MAAVWHACQVQAQRTCSKAQRGEWKGSSVNYGKDGAREMCIGVRACVRKVQLKGRLERKDVEGFWEVRWVVCVKLLIFGN